MGWLNGFEVATPGVEVLDAATIILGQESEPQPDAAVIVDPRAGGRTKLSDDGYVIGPPELVVEIASSSEAYDLYEKKDDYEQLGVPEYLVVVVRSQTIHWHVRRDGRFVELQATDGFYRSEMLPGLWLDAQSLFAGDTQGLHEALRQGLASPEHTALVDRLRKHETGRR